MLTTRSWAGQGDGRVTGREAAVSRNRWVLGLLALAVLSAGCGTTVKTAAGRNGSAGGDAGLSATSPGSSGASATTAPGSTGATAAGAAFGGTASAGPANAGGSGGTTGSAGSGGGSATSPGKPTGITSTLTPATAPGVTNSTIYFGWAYSSSAASGDRAIGAAGAAPSYDERNVFNAVIDYANTHGGFAGRKLQALYYDYNLTTDTSTQDESACAYYTQDNKSFVIPGNDDILDACGQKAGSVLLGAGSATEATFNRYPSLVDPDDVALDRLGQMTVDGLYKAGYFTGKLGLVTWDDPNYRDTITNGYLPALSAHHITPAQIAYISVPQQIGAVGDMTAAVSSAVTKFKSLGIDHVIVQDGADGVWAGDGLTLEWMDQAKSQDYYPRYGENGLNNPGTSLNPSDEQNNLLAVSQIDYDPSYDQGIRANPARTFCFQLEANAGYPVSSSNANDEVTASAACDYVFFLQKVINALPRVTAAAFVQAAQTLGTSFATSEVYGTKFVSGRRDGADEVRAEEYFSSCSCLHFQTSPYYPDGQ